MAENTLFKIYAICAIAVVFLTSSVTSQPADAPSTFAAVFKRCIRDINLPTVPSESDVLEVLLTVTHQKSFFSTFLDCVGNKTMDTFRQSQDTTEWYMARVFDKARASLLWKQYETFDTKVPGTNLTCFTSTDRMTRLDRCLDKVTQSIAVIKQNSGQNLDFLSNVDFSKQMCSDLRAEGTCPADCLAVIEESDCSREQKDFVSSYVMLVMSCKSNEPTTTSTTPISPTPVVVSPTSQPDIHRPMSAFFSCLSIVYPGENFQMLFPPSEISLGLVNDLSQAQRQHEMDLNNFCSKSTQYSECLTLKITNPTNQMDKMLKRYLDVTNFGKTFNEFCARKELVISHFNCTYRATKAYPQCNGGMNDVITTTINMGATNWYMCRQFKTSRECRVTHQLKPCSEEYAMVMEGLLTGVLNEPCRAGELLYPDNEMTDLAPCFGEYVVNNANRISQAFGKETPDANSIVNFYLGEVDIMCRDKEAIFACMSKRLKDSTKKIDTMMKKLFSVENMIKIFDFNCNIMPCKVCVWRLEDIYLVNRNKDLKKNAQCLIGNYMRTANTSKDFTSCLSREMTNVTQAMSQDGLIDVLPPEVLCMGLSSVMKCYTPILSGCDKNMQSKVTHLVDGLKNSCNNPGYTLKFNSESGSGYLSSVPFLVGASMLTAYLVN